MPEKKWTKEQRDAIDARSGTLLVSAAAGSGKTAVLVERVIGLITAPRPVDADRLLVVTFTNAAAAEMKERVLTRLDSLIASDPFNENLQRQQILMQNANISTIHAFCLNLIRDNFESLGIPPDFRVADENEVKVLRAEVLRELLEEKYSGELGEDGGDFLTLADMLGAGRDDSTLEETILRLHDFLVSLPDPEGWCDGKLKMYSGFVSPGESVWGRTALEYARMNIGQMLRAEKNALEVIKGYEKLYSSYAPAFDCDISQLAAAAEYAEKADWDGLFAALHGFDYQKLGSPRKFEPAEVKDWAKSVRDGVKDGVAKLTKGVICRDSEGFAADCKIIYPLAASLFDAAKELDKRFFEKKLERGVLDFSDLERLALRLLTEKKDGALVSSRAAETVSAGFDEVLVDEYQDTNPTQDEIFRAVSAGGEKLFMVGDVKQSIYRFRRATPELFIEKISRFSPYDGVSKNSKIILGRNFRSRAGVTDAVNFVFRLLMTKEFGEMDYGRDEELIPAAEYPPHEDADFELHIVDSSGKDDGDTKEEAEARHIAELIKKAVGVKRPIYDGGESRPARFGDFIVLLRSTSARAEKYKRALTQAGVPVYADVPGGYLDTYEVAMMMSLLRIIDNPMQDVPLLSVMLSPVFGFTPDDLAKIRINNRKGSLYLALCSYASANSGAFGDFLALISRLRSYAAVLPADRLILRIFEETGFLNVCEAMPGGETRRANLRLLLSYARGYEAAGYKGLSGFLRFIDRVSEESSDLAPASNVSESADVVRIMSIHKSKGLEAPVCIIAGCGGRFNREDLQRPAMFHPVYGFGSIIRDPSRGCRFTTVPREVVRLGTERSALSEELRVLYVAMTRAKEKLICVMTLPSPQAAVKKAAACISDKGTLDPLALSQAQGFYEWLLACALLHPDCGGLRNMANTQLEPLKCTGRWKLEMARAGGDEARGEDTARAEPEGEANELDAEIERRIGYEYPYAALSHIPTKAAVSDIAEKDTVNEYNFTQTKPGFLEEDAALTAAEKGTALHLFMQHSRLAAGMTQVDVSAERDRLVAQGFLTAAQGDAVDAGKVLKYLGSDIFARVSSARSVWREMRFNISADAGELAGLNGAGINASALPCGAQVIIQGIADVVFEDSAGLCVLDYKTDRADGSALAARYGKQLALYASAVSQVLGRPVTGRYIYGFSSGETVKV
jgi:ATP-dependent helicase/nuclease subunit A